MKNLHSLKKSQKLLVSVLFLLLFSGSLLAQSVAPNSSISLGTDTKIQEHNENLASKWTDALQEIKLKANDNDTHFSLFTNFYQSYLDSEKCALFQLVQSGKITDGNINEYIDTKKQKLQAMYSNFLNIESEYSSSIANNQGTHNYTPGNAPTVCNGACENIDFSAGNFTGWNGYYGVNSSTTTKFDITSIVGGALGAVAKGAHDPNTNTYQVHITSKAHNDYFLSHYHGINMSQASPFGTSNFAAMIGDSIMNEYGVGILSQQFLVTASNDNLTYDYAIFLENPNHTYYQQPLFTIAVLDANGDTIPNCGDYKVVSGTKLPGFKGEYYPVEGDTVYWKNWTRVNVPLTRYIGQCVTIVFQVSDCALGGHFGYAYVDATCSHLQVSTLNGTPVICGGSGVISAPAGESRYKWIGPSAGSITSSDTIQNITVTKPGTYSVVLTPFTGALCNDTLTTTLTQDSLSLNVSSTNLTCNGNNIGSITATASNGIGAYTYSWSPAVGMDSSATGLSAGTYTVSVTDSNKCSQSVVIVITQPAVLNVSATVSSNVSCNGLSNGSISSSVSGGTLPYTYSWTGLTDTLGVATGLSAGTYTLYVTDNNGCSSSDTIAITQPTALVTSTSVIANISCNGLSNGSAAISANGGTTPYTYSWSGAAGTSDTATGLSYGTYIVSVTDNNGCVSSDTVSITQPAALITSANIITNVSCNGLSNGSASVNVNGGTIPYTYSWSNGAGSNATANGLSAGTYIVSITDNNGCASSDSINITQPAALTTSANTTANVSCNGLSNGSASATVNGGTAPYTYSWTNGAGSNATANGLSAGTYIVYITDNNGCSGSDTITITQPLTLSVSAATTANVSCNGLNNGSASTIVSGGTLPYTYSWTNGAGNANSATGLSAGIYIVSVTDNNGCTSSAVVTITQPGSLSLSSSVINVTCNGLSNGFVSAAVTGGTTPYTYSWNNGATTASIAGLSAGTYTISVIDNNGCSNSSAVTITQPNTLLVSAGVSANVSCNGMNNGIATSSVSGGTVPYKYSWSSGGTNANASGLSAGTYTVSVSDINGCDASATVIISQPATLSASASTTANVTCHGNNNGSASSSVSGGTLPYTYSWSAGAGTKSTATGLSAGTYTLTVTDNNGCSSSSSTVITQPNGISISVITIPNVICNCGRTINNNGSASATVSGGTIPYTYAWSGGAGTNATATGLATGTYTLTVKDNNGCSSSALVTITQTTTLNISATTTSNVSCYGEKNGSASVTVTGNTSPYTYSWSCGAGGNKSTVTGLSAGTYTVIVTDKDGCTGSAIVIITQPTSIGISISKINVSCHGDNNGSASATVTGGTTPYTYSWSGGAGTKSTATGLIAGTYTLTVTDKNGCLSSVAVIITQPTSIGISVSSVNVTCHGDNNGSASTTVTGGTTPYTYSWSGAAGTKSTATGLIAGTYTLTVTDKNGCSTTTSATITQPAALSLSVLTTANVTCHGDNNGSASSTVSGGTTPYIYSWTSGAGNKSTASGLVAGTYTLTVTDKNGCSATAGAVITQPATLSASVTTTANVTLCYGDKNGSISSTVTGGTLPYTYLWSGSAGSNATATGLTAGAYTLNVTDKNGCKSSATAIITQPTELVASIKSQNCTNKKGSVSIAVTGGASPYTYSWSPGGETSATETGLSAGSYTITVTDKNGCESTVSVDVCPNTPSIAAGVDNTNQLTADITLYPSPTTGQFNIAGLQKGMLVQIFDYRGRMVRTITTNGAETMQFDLFNQPNGIYLVRILSGDGTLVSQKKVVKAQ